MNTPERYSALMRRAWERADQFNKTFPVGSEANQIDDEEAIPIVIVSPAFAMNSLAVYCEAKRVGSDRHFMVRITDITKD